MSPVLLAKLELEYACACDPDELKAADAHALDCYRRQLIDADTLRRLRGLAPRRDGAR